jgi:hypothetical protein
MGPGGREGIRGLGSDGLRDVGLIFRNNETVLKWNMVLVAQVCEYTKSHTIRVNYMVHELLCISQDLTMLGMTVLDF